MATTASKKKTKTTLIETNDNRQERLYEAPKTPEEWRALADAVVERMRQAGELTDEEEEPNDATPAGLAHYKARRDKKWYTQDELERIALTQAVLEALENQEPLYP